MNIAQWFDLKKDAVIDTANKIFATPELCNNEEKSSHTLAVFLEREGFEVSWNTAGLPTAFTAVWGSGKPTLGFLAEYDALPSLGQEPVPYRRPIEGNGHGCGHNLFGSAIGAAASALKAEMEERKLSGTLIVYGCPAEEDMSGKIVMNKAGVFDALDAAITWHPFDRNRISNDIWLSQDIKNFRFYGTSAHAARNPELGRSALDAAELMNIGVNYLREHVADDVRMHYCYVHADQPANVVPDFVETNYFIRSGKRARTEDVSSRVDDCAKGAALMTGTRVEIDCLGSCKEMKVNRPLMEIFYQAMKQVPLPVYTEEELTFAEKITEAAGLLNDGNYFGGLEPLEDHPSVLSIGTDASDVSHTVPLVTVSAACMCKGTPLHHWSTTAQAGMSIGHKGMLYAARSMALGALSLIEKPELLEDVWKEFRLTD